MERYGHQWQYNLKEIQWKGGNSSIVKSFKDLHKETDISRLLEVKQFRWTIYNGVKVYFWEDNWHEEGPLYIQFPRLYRISELKLSTVKEFLSQFELGKNMSGMWSRQLKSRDDTQWGELKRILDKIKLSK